MDQALFEKLTAGDEDAFRDLVTLYQDRVYRVCFRFLRNAEDAQDAAQDVFVEAYKNISSFRAEAEISTWLHRIAANKSLDAIRRKKRKKRSDGPVSPFAAGGRPAADPPASDSFDPEKAYEAGERARILHQAVSSLPDAQRVAITLSRYEGLGNAEIAGVLGVTVVSVDSLIYRAHKSLRKCLHEHYARQLKSEGRK